MKLLSEHKIFPLIFFVTVALFFFYPAILKNVPIPADTIVGLYHPWRDFFSKEFPSGVPFKNFLITDPVRQQYPWRNLSIDLMKQGQMPLWNPYNFSGTPLLANFQSAPFYPLNILFVFLPFNIAWTIQIILEPILAGFFLYYFLRQLNISSIASFFGGFVWAFCGFNVAWMEWNTVVQAALWLPLILLSIDKIILGDKRKVSWLFILTFSLSSSLLAGHLQTFFYVFILSIVYLISRWWQKDKRLKTLLKLLAPFLIFFIITSKLWFPTLQFILLSARNFDQGLWTKSGWFIPWQNLIQFVAPDFFGNPATLNYWGEWNYGEFIGYIGIIPLILALFAIFERLDEKTLFFGSLTFISLIFALPTPLAEIPYRLQIPLISTSQPTRLLFLTDFSLAVLAALGLDFFLKKENKIFLIVLFLGLIFSGLWIFAYFGRNIFPFVTLENISIVKRNLLLPTLLLFLGTTVLVLTNFLRSKKYFSKVVCIVVLGITIFDLFRFFGKYESFSSQKFLFPQTETVQFLQNQPKPFRFMTTDSRIFPPNFSSFYKLEDVAGYDPLYLKNYGELVAAWTRNKPDISPASFNRILTPQNYSSFISDILGVKYVLSLKEETSPKLKLVFQEGETRVYENLNALPRVFYIEKVTWVDNKQEAINEMFNKDFNPQNEAIAEIPPDMLFLKTHTDWPKGSVKIMSYTENKIILETENNQPGFLILTNISYPGWHVYICALSDRNCDFETKTYIVDYAFIGIPTTGGKARIEIVNSL